MSFIDRLDERSAALRSHLCLGLDPDPAKLPGHLSRDAEGVYQFCAAIMDATSDIACAFKPNIAFFEALGAPGIETLGRLRRSHPGALVLIDAKRGDIGSTAEAYARALFDELGADAVTLSPYLGGDSLEPFLRRPERGCFILCKTSNPGSGDLQDLEVGGEPLYMHVARLVAGRWGANRNAGLVVGATHPGALAQVRAACPDVPLLIPGVGAQGGDLADSARAAGSGGGRMLINASRSIMYASAGADFAEAARAEAQRLRDAIGAALAD